MSSSDITFNKVEKLLEEVQILQPSLEILFARAESMRDINKEALLLNRELSKNLKDFDEIIKNSINGELNERLKELDKFNDLESNVNKNISYLRKEINKIQSFKTLKCFLAMALIASIYYFDKVNNIF